MLETAERLASEEKEPSVQQFLLLVGGLRAMAAGEHRPAQVLDSYLLRALSVAGYAPSFEHCAHCGLEGPHRWFNPSMGGVLCATCRVPGSASPAAETVTCSAPCSPATGRSSRRPPHGSSPRRAAWSRRTSSGTSSAVSGRCAHVERS